jgi:hypothetical protein
MRLPAVALIGLALAGGAAVKEVEMAPPAGRSTDLPPPRDPNIAVRQELDAARRAGTVAAYDLFIARQSDHPLAEVARRERARLAVRGKAKAAQPRSASEI